MPDSNSVANTPTGSCTKSRSLQFWPSSITVLTHRVV